MGSSESRSYFARRPARPAGAPRDGADASLANAWLSASTVRERWRFELLAGAPERAEATARASLERFQAMGAGRGRRHAQSPAYRLHAEAATILIDEAAHLGRSASSSVAKNTLAALRTSSARRSS